MLISGTYVVFFVMNPSVPFIYISAKTKKIMEKIDYHIDFKGSITEPEQKILPPLSLPYLVTNKIHTIPFHPDCLIPRCILGIVICFEYAELLATIVIKWEIIHVILPVILTCEPPLCTNTTDTGAGTVSSRLTTMRYHFIQHPHPRTQHSPRPAQS